MEYFNSIPDKFSHEYDTVELIKKSRRSSIFMLRKKESGERFILRTFEGTAEVYKKLMAVSCPNLPKIYSAEEHDGTAVVLEEYVQGDTLYDVLCGGVLSEEEAEKIILQLCESLRELHKINIVHRDIKPENVIIRGSEAVLIDFDASRMVDPEKDTDTRILGTTGFAAPEQYGISQTDARADIYSLGVMLNVMLTGEHPSIKLASGSYGDIIQKCTMISPDKRYQNAEEVIKSIEKKKSRPKKYFAAAVFAAAVILAAVLLALWINTEKEEPIPESEGTSLYSWEVMGESSILPEDFYYYWSADEFIRPEQIRLSISGGLEKYADFKFADDVLNIIVKEIPPEDYSAFSIGDELFVVMEVEAPSEDVEWEFSHQGNGPTYINMKNQIASGEEPDFYSYSEGERITRKRSLAKMVSVDGEDKIAFYDTDQIFYLVIAWKNSAGEIEMQILPYRVLTEKEAEKIFEFDTWMDIFWEPVSDPERIIFREVYGDYNFYNEKEMEDAGMILDVFTEPGEITVKTGAVSKVDIETIANAEAYLLPPDATPKREEETYEQWLERIDAETKYVGYICGHSTGVSHQSMSAELINDILDENPFFYVDNHHSCATNIMETTKSEIDGTTVWTTKDDTKDVVMVIDWYTEDLNVNPEAKPEKREYLYTDVTPFIYYDSEEIIAGGYCGKDGKYSSVVWNLNKNGVLSINGKGEIEDYPGSEFVQEINAFVIEAPWGEFAEECKTLVLGEGITVIGSRAFMGMKNLSGKLIIPESVKEIKAEAFLGCGFDCELTIPESVKTIEEAAFAEWSKGGKGKLVIEEGLEHLGSNAFFGGNFSSVQLPSTLRDMQASAFDGNRSLEEFSISENNRDLCLVDDVIYTKDMEILVEVLCTKTGKFTVPAGVKIIGIGAFQWSNLESVTIPENVEVISRGAFQAFEGEVHIMGSLQSIDDFAFYPKENGKTSVYFHKDPPENVYGAGSKSPSFCEYAGDIDIFINREYEDKWELDPAGLWKGYGIFQKR